jgi:hypothetical protein
MIAAFGAEAKLWLESPTTKDICFLYPDISFVQPSTYNFFPLLYISFCLQPLWQWKHHNLWGESCCCVAAGSLLLRFHWCIVEFSGNHDRPRREFASQHPPWYGGAKLKVLTQSPHRRLPQPTRLELQPVWVWSSASVSAAISKSNVHTCEMTSVRLEPFSTQFYLRIHQQTKRYLWIHLLVSEVILG